MPKKNEEKKYYEEGKIYQTIFSQPYANFILTTYWVLFIYSLVFSRKQYWSTTITTLNYSFSFGTQKNGLLVRSDLSYTLVSFLFYEIPVNFHGHVVQVNILCCYFNVFYL